MSTWSFCTVKSNYPLKRVQAVCFNQIISNEFKETNQTVRRSDDLLSPWIPRFHSEIFSEA